MEDQPRWRVSKYRAWIGVCLLCYWILLFISTHTPSPESLMPAKVSDKLLHFGAFGLLTVLVTLWVSTTRKLNWKTAIGIIVGIAIYAAIDECLQMLPFINRTCDLFDWFADMGGCLVGLTLVGGTMAVQSALSRRR